MSFNHVSKRVILTDAKGTPYSATNPVPAKIAGALSGGKNADGGIAALTLNDVSKAIVFNLAFTAAPAVQCKIILPDNTQPGIDCWPDYSTLTATGVTILFEAAIPASGFKLSWQAVGS